jgi:hypothetical protein
MIETMCLPSSVLGMVLGCLPLLGLARVRTVCKQWSQTRAHVSFLKVAYNEVVELVEPLQVRTLDIHTAWDPRLHARFTEARALKIWLRKQEPDCCCVLLGLRTLNLAGSLLSQSSLACLSRLRQLHVLVLRATGIDARHLAQLAGVPWLTGLCLDQNVDVDDAALGKLSALVQLRRLGLSGLHQVTDAGLLSLSCLRELESLDLSRTRVRGHQLEQLSTVRVLRLSMSLVHRPNLTLPPALRLLDLRSTRSALNSQQQLESLASLKELDVCGCELVADDFLLALSRKAHLRQLSVSGVTSCLMNHFWYTTLTREPLVIPEFEWNKEFT